jgi:hypothetical protein
MQLAQIVRRNLCQITDAYAAATGTPRSVVSKRFYGRSSFLDEYRQGKQTITVDKLDGILRALRREWPDNADWPFLPAIFMDRRNGK